MSLTIEQLCHGCGKEMFNKVPPGERGFIGEHPDSELKLQSDEADNFYVCPHCGAQNVVDVESVDGESARLTITHIKK